MTAAPSSFDASKESTLLNLEQGFDLSFKGSVDAPVAGLVEFLNLLPDCYTTSSCSGRVSVYHSRPQDSQKDIKWIFVRHRLIDRDELLQAITDFCSQLEAFAIQGIITLKCEALILHLCCRSVDAAAALHELATRCGFRESGITVGQKRVMLAVRSASFTMEVPVARNGQLLVSQDYLSLLVEQCNQRLSSNFQRIDRFLSLLKSHFKWPSLLLPSRQYGLNNLNACPRWGHTCCALETYPSPASVIMGGYGLPKASASKCTRLRESLLLSQQGDNAFVLSPFSARYTETGDEAAMHATSLSVTLTYGSMQQPLEGEVIITSGGRTSPAHALPVLSGAWLLRKKNCGKNETVRSFERPIDSSQPVPIAFKHTMDADQAPCPRWGHSLNVVWKNRKKALCLLYGGRDANTVYNDIHLLEIQIKMCTSAADTTYLLDVSWQKVSIEGPPVLPRFFHATCAVPRVSLQHDLGVAVKTFIDRQRDDDAVYYILVHGGLSSLDCSGTLEAAMVIDIRYGVQYPLFDQQDRAWIRLFGHTITSMGCSSLLICGGQSFQSKVTLHESCDASIGASVIDLHFDSQLRLRGSYRCCECYEMQHEPIAPIHDLYHHIRPKQSLPCSDCRVHHQVSATKLHDRRRVLTVLGGGAMTLAFGAHFCSDFTAMIVPMNGIQRTSKQPVHLLQSNATISETPLENQRLSKRRHPVEIDSFLSIYAPSGLVRRLKLCLEAHRLLNKAGRIVRLPVALTSIAEQVNGVRISNGQLEKVPHDNITPLLEQIERGSGNGTTSGVMALPITQGLYNAFDNLHWLDAINDLHQVLGKDFIVFGSHHVPGTDDARSKQLLASTQYKVQRFLREFCAAIGVDMDQLVGDNNSYSSKSNAFKFEMVGDVLVFPTDFMSSSRWSEYLQLSGEQSMTFYRSMMRCFNAKRVARKATIDSGPMRQSHVRLLYPQPFPPVDCERSEAILPIGCESPGWVLMWENSICFGFDITRVMFCSGNVTERMRMANVVATGETVLDLYCGIGYYTLPLLVHAGANHVYACEWNPHSVAALRQNLKVATASFKKTPSRKKNDYSHAEAIAERCTVYEGDNAVTMQRHELHDIADRVLLGLLPSSMAGWPLAARALKPSGGMVHVHENVLESDLETWTRSTAERFNNLMRDAGKPQLFVQVEHLEKVKSYAPRVLHVVLDLRFTCRTDSET